MTVACRQLLGALKPNSSEFFPAHNGLLLQNLVFLDLTYLIFHGQCSQIKKVTLTEQYQDVLSVAKVSIFSFCPLIPPITNLIIPN